MYSETTNSLGKKAIFSLLCLFGEGGQGGREGSYVKEMLFTTYLGKGEYHTGGET